MSAAAAASAAHPARALGPSSATSPASVSGPRELLITTSYPLVTANRATWLPMLPAPINPMVVMSVANRRRHRDHPEHGAPAPFPPVGPGAHRSTGQQGRTRGRRPGVDRLTSAVRLSTMAPAADPAPATEPATADPVVTEPTVRERIMASG